MLIEEIIFCFGMCVVVWEITMMVLLNRVQKHPHKQPQTRTVVERRIEAARRRGYRNHSLWNTNQPLVNK